jgi:FixJ family two-component response regulator
MCGSVLPANCSQDGKGSRVAAEPLICIVDDDPSLQKALVRLIQSLGYAARGFASAEAFITSDIMPACSCVVTDIQMPGMSGIDLKRFMNASDCRVPVIMITARTEPDLEQSALSAGAICFLRKPVDTTLLSDCLVKALNQ